MKDGAKQIVLPSAGGPHPVRQRSEQNKRQSKDVLLCLFQGGTLVFPALGLALLLLACLVLRPLDSNYLELHR